MLLAKIRVGQRQRLSDIPVSRAGDRDPARLRQTLQTGRDVHAVPQQVAAPNHHVPHVHSDPELKAAILRLSGARLCQLLLDRDGALDGIDGARELGQHAIASGVGDPAPWSRISPSMTSRAAARARSVPASSWLTRRE